MNKLQLVSIHRSAQNAAVRGGSLGGLDALRLEDAALQAVFGGPPLSEAELAGLHRLGRVQRAEVGELVLRRAMPADQLVAVLQGSVGLGLARDDEPFHLERTIRGPQWLDVSSGWLGEGFALDAAVITEARLLWLPLDGVRALMQLHPEMNERLLLALAHKVHSLTHVTHDLMHKDAERRLAAWFLQVCQPAAAACRPGESIVASLKERKRDIAAQLAITPETLSRMIRQLKRKGVVEVQGYTITVLDWPQLQRLAQD